MKIAVWHNLPSGGGKRALYDHVKYLVAAGHEVTAWCPETADRSYLPLRHLIVEHETAVPAQRLDASLRWLCAQAQVNASLLERLQTMEAHSAAAGRQIEQSDADVLLSASCAWFHAPSIGRHVSLPKVVYLQEPCRDLYEAAYAHRTTLRWLAEPAPRARYWSPTAIRAWLGSAARVHPYRVQAREELGKIKAFDRILVNSLFSRENVYRTYGLPSDVCYLGIDANQFPDTGEPRSRFLLTVGAFGTHKNPELLIRAVGESQSKPPLVWVANIVDGEPLEKAQRLADSLHVSLTIKTNISDEQLGQLYRQGTALLYAPRLEPFGLAPLEANSSGMPVIGAAEGGVRETVTDGVTGLLVEPQSGALAAAIDRLMADSDLAHRLGNQGSKTVREQWTTERAGQRLEQHLRDVASTRRNART